MAMNPHHALAGGGQPVGAAPGAPHRMHGPLSARPVASAAHLGWLYYDETSGGTWACVYGSGGFAWVIVGPWVGVPANQGASGTAGHAAYDSSYFYVAIGTNNWKRVAWTPGDAW